MRACISPAPRCLSGSVRSLRTWRRGRIGIRCRYRAASSPLSDPSASWLIGAETDADVFGPLRALVKENGAVVLMGVGLTRMTLLHLAEVEAGRRPFIRWAAVATVAQFVAAAACAQRASSPWRGVSPRWNGDSSLERASGVCSPPAKPWNSRPTMFRTHPSITHCPNPECIECADAFVAGRARPNTVRAVASDLKTFFTVVGKDPVEVIAADVFEFLARPAWRPHGGPHPDRRVGPVGAHDRPSVVVGVGLLRVSRRPG